MPQCGHYRECNASHSCYFKLENIPKVIRFKLRRDVNEWVGHVAVFSRIGNGSDLKVGYIFRINSGTTVVYKLVNIQYNNLEYQNGGHFHSITYRSSTYF